MAITKVTSGGISDIAAAVEGASDSNKFTDADHSKLDGVAASANNYVHPNHSGDVVSAADGAMTIQTDAVDIAMLSATGTPGSTTFLRGDNAWATAGSTSASDLTSGTLPIARIADGAVTAAKVAADVATQAELDTVSTVASAALPKAGGTMTGTVISPSFNSTAGGTFTTASGNDLNLVYPDGRSLFIKEAGTTHFTVDNEGKISTWQGTGMTSHFNVGNRDIDVGTSTGFANRQERIGLMAADPWGTAAGIYLSVSRNTNQDGRSHPSLHFTGNHGAGQSEDYLMMSMNSNFYGAESVNIGSSANDANLEVNGQLTVIKQPSFYVGASPSKDSSNYVHSFGTIHHNIGSHYVNSTGRFTAPVAGRYLFTAGLWAQAGSDDFVMIAKNQTGTGAGAHAVNSSATSGTVSVVFNLAVNDYVSLHCGYAIQGSTPRNFFSGQLLG